ncbi:MAG: hypothetical protein F6K22_24730 [Okeania sp. SIO2F4]|uniref:hypothetical protein n=1 Tax=Okeania sp. SIO2F4 TaxID=2607790 RepID=UPI0014291946|nr:hypothetical protein [Okeania sp. SIO2F4]MDJ0518227.1 hypothetical protein [Trichodesmium sp. MO_231.B1]NES05732.1 hypothetical protein [Okeania sp. SIO2F4]
MCGSKTVLTAEASEAKVRDIVGFIFEEWFQLFNQFPVEKAMKAANIAFSTGAIASLLNSSKM